MPACWQFICQLDESIPMRNVKSKSTMGFLKVKLRLVHASVKRCPLNRLLFCCFDINYDENWIFKFTGKLRKDKNVFHLKEQVRWIFLTWHESLSCDNDEFHDRWIYANIPGILLKCAIVEWSHVKVHLCITYLFLRHWISRLSCRLFGYWPVTNDHINKMEAI